MPQFRFKTFNMEIPSPVNLSQIYVLYLCDAVRFHRAGADRISMTVYLNRSGNVYFKCTT